MFSCLKVGKIDTYKETTNRLAFENEDAQESTLYARLYQPLMCAQECRMFLSLYVSVK